MLRRHLLIAPVAGLMREYASGSAKEKRTVRLWDALTLRQRADSKTGTFSVSALDAVSRCLTDLETAGGGVLEWASVMIDGPIFIHSSNISIVPKDGARLILRGRNRHAIRALPRSLVPLLDLNARPRHFPSGIQGEGYETLLYEPRNAHRLSDISIWGLQFETDQSDGARFLDAYSVDNIGVHVNVITTPTNGINLWYCRAAQCGGNIIHITRHGGGFPIFLFKSVGDVFDNHLSNGSINFEAKGCYPQPGASVFDKFDATYNFHHPVRFFRNLSQEFHLSGASSGYRDNSSADISAYKVGILKREWFGKTSGVEYFQNTFKLTNQSASIDAGAVVVNINSLNHNAHRNITTGCGFVSLASEAFSVIDNKIYNHNVPSTAAIVFRGGIFGQVTENSRNCVAIDNTISDQITRSPAIYLRGATQCVVRKNRIIHPPARIPPILVDSTQSDGLSRRNIVEGNMVYGAIDIESIVETRNAANTTSRKNAVAR